MTTQPITRHVDTDDTIRTTAPAPRAWRRRAANISLWALQVMTAAVFVMAALPKLTADPMAVAGFTAMGLGATGMFIIGVLEVAGAIGLFIPRLTGLAALCFVALMIGAVTVTALMLGVGLVAMPAVVGVLAAIIAWGRRRSTVELVATVRRYTHRSATAQ